MLVNITNNDRVRLGVETAQGQAFIAPGATKPIDVTDEGLRQAREHPRLVVEYDTPAALPAPVAPKLPSPVKAPERPKAENA